MIHQLRRQHPHLPGRPPLPPKTAAAHRVPLSVGGRVRTMAAVLIDPNGASEPTSQLPPGGCCDDHLNPPSSPASRSPVCCGTTPLRSAGTAKEPGATTSSSSGFGVRSNTKRSTFGPTTVLQKPRLRSALPGVLQQQAPAFEP